MKLVNCQNLIYYSTLNPSPYRWLTNLLSSKKLPGSFRLVSKRPMFAGLKSMFISLKSIDNFCFEKYVNPHFPQLEQFSCLGLKLGKTCLSLVNLKVLSLFELSRSPGNQMRLELPSMYKLLTDLSLDAFEFAHPQTVTHLLLFDDHESIARLTNLECFSCAQLVNESTTFSNLVKLKEIHLGLNSDERLAEIYREKERLGRHELKMFVHGVDYQINRRYPTFPEVFGNFLSRKHPLPFISPIRAFSYDDMLDALDGQTIPSDLLSNFIDIRTIVASRRTEDDIDLFLRFLSSCSNLFTLTLESAFDELSDGQACYDSLPSRCRFLRELELESSGNRTTRIDLNFVLGFDYLQKFTINQNYSPHLKLSLFIRLKYFRVFEMTGNIRSI